MMSGIRVVHFRKSKYDIYIGRPSKFGNPFIIGKDGSRDEVISKFREWIYTGNNFGNADAEEWKREWILSSLKSLEGKTLGCWCAPNACHGDVLKELFESMNNEKT